MLFRKKFFTYVVIFFIAFLTALSFEIFVFPNDFAPAGLGGLCTMFQYLTGISSGYPYFLVNLPLAIALYFKVSKTLAIRSSFYVVTLSVAQVVLREMDLSAFAYQTENSALLGPLVGGILYGALSAILLKCSAHCGGADSVASLVHKRRPDMSFFWVSFGLSASVAVLSFFVYGQRLEPVLLCILYNFALSSVLDSMTRSGRSAVRFEIVTKDPDTLAKILTEQFHHGATLIPAKGVYRGTPTNILVCIVNKTQSAQLTSILRTLPDTFATCGPVTEVMGPFQQLNAHNKPEVQFLDEGEGNGL